MPYIPKPDRERIDAILIKSSDMTTGELNYTITKLLLNTRPQRYHDYNALIGVLECCKLELYRRAVAVYEQGAIERNGDLPGYGGGK